MCYIRISDDMCVTDGYGWSAVCSFQGGKEFILPVQGGWQRLENQKVKYLFPFVNLTWHHVVVHFSFFRVRIDVVFSLRVSFKVSLTMKMSFFGQGNGDFAMKFVDKVTSCQFGSCKQVLTVMAELNKNVVSLQCQERKRILKLANRVLLGRRPTKLFKP